jgi:hypothetical protein
MRPLDQSRPRRLCTALLGGATLLVAGLCWLPAAKADQAEATVAIARAEAKIDLVSHESAAATQNRSFSTAQGKLTEAHAALSRNQDQKAEWLANEAELLADITAGSAQLAGLERTRAQVSHDADVLGSEIRK